MQAYLCTIVEITRALKESIYWILKGYEAYNQHRGQRWVRHSQCEVGAGHHHLMQVSTRHQRPMRVDVGYQQESPPSITLLSGLALLLHTPNCVHQSWIGLVTAPYPRACSNV